MSDLGRALVSWLGPSVLALASLAAAGWWPTRRLGGDAALASLMAGGGVGFAGALLGALPILGAVARGGSERPHVTAGWAMALRSGATVLGAAALALGSSLPRTALLAWVALSYGALLVIETRWAVRWLRPRKS